MSTDERAILGFLRRAGRRKVAAAMLRGAGMATALAVGCLALGWSGLASRVSTVALGAAVILVGAALGGWIARQQRSGIALEVERQAPDFRNLLVTAAELLGGVESPRRSASRPWHGTVSQAIVNLVASRAADQVSRTDPKSLFPLHQRALWLVAGLALWGSLAVALPAPGTARSADVNASATTATPAGGVDPAIAVVEVSLSPPPHTGLAPRSLVDPARLEVVEGTRIGISIRGVADVVQLATLEGSREIPPSADGVFTAELVAAADGFVSLEPRVGDRAGPRRLVGLMVTADAAPRVRITEPGRDLFLPQADVEIPISAAATDDFGLAELRLTYTIVSGSGETFEFTEGELAGRTARDEASSWRIGAELRPADLGLSLGDMVVYRAVARDVRPDAPEVKSDAFVVEIVGENAAITGGFALESDEEREALSQRMIIIKTERLLANRGSMSEQDYAAEARRLAAEQRLVRAEFVFMMGGEVQDEVEEAEHEHEVAAGRLELAGRQEMSRAVQWMSQAATLLTDADLEAALPLEESALEALQSALSRSRYILRTMAPRQSIDLSRRLSGAPGPPQAARAAESVTRDPEVAALRRLLAEIAGAASAGDGVDREVFTDLAERVLRFDPSSDELQAVAAGLASAAASRADPATATARAIEVLRALLEARIPMDPSAPDADPALAGALSEEMMRSGGGR